MTSVEMGRKRRSYNLDERVIEALAEISARANSSANRFLENLLWELGKSEGVLPKNAKPLGETRGGDRSIDEDDSND